MPEDHEGFISLTLRSRKSKKPLRMLARNWKRRWLLLCLATGKKCKHGETRSKPNDFKSKFACILEASESTRLRMEESLPNYHEDHIAGKGNNSLQHENLVHRFIPMPQAMKVPAAKAAVDKEWEKLEKIPAGDLPKVRSQKEVIDEARTKGAKVDFASLVDICHLKNAALEAKHQKYKGRGDIVKDDSGSYAVFTKQGSSASQITAAKVMDIISRLPGCAGQAADAVSAETQVKNWKMLQNYWKFPNRNVHTFGFVYHDKNGPNHGPVWKTQWFLLSGICTVILWQDCYGKGNLSKSHYSYTVKKGYSYLCVWMTSKWLERNKILIQCGNYSTKRLIWENQHLSLIMKTWSVLKDNVKWAKIVDNYRTMFESRISAGATEKLPCSEIMCISSWSYHMEGHAKKSTTPQSLNSMHWWPSLQRRRIEIRGRLVKSMLSNCSEMLILGTNWKTWYSMVSEQTSTIDHKMDKSLWQTIMSFGLLHSSYMWIQTVMLCGKHCQTMQTGTVSRLRFCRRSWGFNIYIRWNIVHFWKSYACSNQLDV